jgi:hypothetical protein
MDACWSIVRACGRGFVLASTDCVAAEAGTMLSAERRVEAFLVEERGLVAILPGRAQARRGQVPGGADLARHLAQVMTKSRRRSEADLDERPIPGRVDRDRLAVMGVDGLLDDRQASRRARRSPQESSPRC